MQPSTSRRATPPFCRCTRPRSSAWTSPPPDDYVIGLVNGVADNTERIDDLVARYAIDWTLDRMPVVDRTLLRMATYELLDRPDVPTGAIISEAVELAKTYSTDESGRF